MACAMPQPVPHALVLRGVGRLLQRDLRMAECRLTEVLIVLSKQPDC